MNRRLAAAVIVLAAAVAPARFGATSLLDGSPVLFRDVAAESGVTFTHTNGASPSKHIVETMGSGGLLFDYDGDGWLDVFLVDGGSVVDPRAAAPGAIEAVSQSPRRHVRRCHGGVEDRAPRVRDGRLRGGLRQRRPRRPVPDEFRGERALPEQRRRYVRRHDQDRGRRRLGPEHELRVRRHRQRWPPRPVRDELRRSGRQQQGLRRQPRARVLPAGRLQRRRRAFCTGTTATARSATSREPQASTEPTARASASSSATTTTMAASISSWRTIWCPTSCFTTRGAVRFARSGCLPASRSPATAAPGPAWARISAITTATDASIWPSRTSRWRRTTCTGTSEAGCSPTPRWPAAWPPPRSASSGSAPCFSTTTTTAASTSPSPTGTCSTTPATFSRRPDTRSASCSFTTTAAAASPTSRQAPGPGFALERVSRTIVAGDVDNDGDLDLLVTNNGQAANLLRNDGGNRGNAVLVQSDRPREQPRRDWRARARDRGRAEPDSRDQGRVELPGAERSPRALRRGSRQGDRPSRGAVAQRTS